MITDKVTKVGKIRVVERPFKRKEEAKKYAESLKKRGFRYVFVDDTHTLKSGVYHTVGEEKLWRKAQNRTVVSVYLKEGEKLV